MTTRKKVEPIHPGEVLLEEILKPMNLSQNRLASDLGVLAGLRPSARPAPAQPAVQRGVR